MVVSSQHEFVEFAIFSHSEQIVCIVTVRCVYTTEDYLKQ